MIVRWFLALIALAYAIPATAQDGGLRGVWQGTIGDLPVRACFGGEDANGVYYYDRHRLLIRLLNEEGVFSEAIGYGDPGAANWRFSQLEGGRANGEWRDGRRAVPIRLSQVDWYPRNEWDNPCESGAFINPRLAGGTVRSEAATLEGPGVGPGEGQAYIRLDYVPPSHFSADDVQISTFALLDEHWGDHAINYALAYDLPRGDLGDALGDCFAMMAAVNGMDGYFHKLVRPELLSARWLGVIESNNLYCGGAHPSHWTKRRVFDRNAGIEVNPLGWLNDRGVARELLSSGGDTSVYTRLSEDLVAVLIAHWPGATETHSVGEQELVAECIDLARSMSSWDIGLGADGMAFIPQVPHAMMPCAETVNVPWAQLAHFLSLEGQAARESLAQ